MAQSPVKIANQQLSLAELRKPMTGPCTVTLEAEVQKTIAASHQAIAELLRSDLPIYGVNTGFGKLAKARIAMSELGQLQVNLVRSHAAGVGAPLSPPVVRLMLALKAASLARGASGVPEAPRRGADAPRPRPPTRHDPAQHAGRLRA